MYKSCHCFKIVRFTFLQSYDPSLQVRLPVDVSAALIFTHTALQKLRARIEDVHTEKVKCFDLNYNQLDLNKNISQICYLQASLKHEIGELRIKHKQLTRLNKVKQVLYE